MLFGTSCSDEELTYESASKQNVSFKVQVEGADVGSRTIADGTNHITIGKGQMVNKLFYAVYETGGTECLMEGEADVNNGLATVVIPLVNGLHFDLVFLAYNDKNNIFEIPETLTFSGGLCSTVDLVNLTLRSDLKANQEAYDAFYHVESDYVTNTNSTSPVTLRRMLAQLNVATTDSDLSQAKQLKADITQTAITLKDVPNQFNARTGVASGETTVSYGVSDILKCSAKPEGQVHANEQLKVNIDGEEKNFNYLAMAYVLANKDESSLHDTKVSFYRTKNSNAELVHTRTIPTLPIQRQFRTNVTGNVLTQQEAFNISLDVDFGNKNESVGDVVVVANATSLQQAINNAQDGVPVEIQLDGDVTLGVNSSSTYSRATENATLIISAKKNIILDLNGHNLSYAVTNTGASAIIDNRGTLSIINTGENKDAKLNFVAENPDTQEIPSYATNTISNTGTLTIGENVTVTNESDGGASYAVDNHAFFTLDGGTLIGNRCALRVAKYNPAEVKFTMNSGLVQAATPAWIQLPGSSATDAPKITVDIKGGIMKSTKELSADNNVMYTYSFGNSHANTIINISGGEFIGGTVSIGSGYYDDAPTLNITGGEFDYPVLKWLEDNKSEAITVISTAENLRALSAKILTGNNNISEKATITIVADIDMKGEEFSAIIAQRGDELIVVGNNHTISNVKVVSGANDNTTGQASMFYAYPNSTLTVSDLTLKDITVTADANGTGYAAAVVGYCEGTAELDNVNIVNATITGVKSSGMLVGHLSGSLEANGCELSGAVTLADFAEEANGHYAGKYIGTLAGAANLENCSANVAVSGNLNVNNDGTVYGRMTEAGSLSNSGIQYVATTEKFKNAIEKGVTDVCLYAGNYEMPEPDLRGKTLTISGTKNTVIDASNVDARDQFVTGATLVFEGVTLNFGVENYMGFANTSSLTFKNCKITGLQFLYGENVTFENCEFDSSANTKEPHAVWTYGAKNVNFIDCKFTYGNRGINCYSDNDVPGGKQVVNFTNCTFTTTDANSEGAVEINSSFFSVGIEVNMEGCTAPAHGQMAYISQYDSTNGEKTTINIK